jgi:hypothetical protein
MAERYLRLGRNPDPRSRLPVLVGLPVEGEREVVLATREAWPRAKDLFCYELPGWPEGAEVTELVPVERCWRAGKAIRLVLRRRRQRRSLFVWTERRGRPLIFWRSQTSARGARPGVRVPTARALERAIVVAVDQRERYGWTFRRYGATTVRRELPVGDYAVLVDERLAAVVERKSVEDLARGLTGGDLALQLAELSRLPHAALVVEGRLSDLLKAGAAAGVRGGWLMNLVAGLTVEYPHVAWLFGETKALAEDFAYRFLAAALHAEGGVAGIRAARQEGPLLLDRAARQERILADLAAGASLTVAEWMARAHLSYGAALRDLKELVAAGRVEEVREGRRHVYRAPSS